MDNGLGVVTFFLMLVYLFKCSVCGYRWISREFMGRVLPDGVERVVLGRSVSDAEDVKYGDFFYTSVSI